MKYTTEEVQPGTVGFDTSANLLAYSVSQLQALYRAAYRPGYRPFMIRYLGLDPVVVGPYDLTQQEMDLLLTIGFSLCAVQERITGPWNATNGFSDGVAAAKNAAKIGLLPSVCIFSGAEIADRQSCIDYENGWWNGALSINAALDPALGVYVGSNALDGAGWQSLVPQHRYWKSAANVPTPSSRGYQNYQLWPGDRLVAGIDVDWNCAQTDWKGANMIVQVAV
jgi:hypothetical protein